MTQTPPPVPRRRLGRTELSVPVIPFGTQGFGNHFGFVSDEDAVALIRHAVSLGVNHFDCARCYGDLCASWVWRCARFGARMSLSRGVSAATRMRRGAATGVTASPIIRQTG